MTHQTPSLEKYWKLFPATLRTELKHFLVREKAGWFRTLFAEGKLEIYAVRSSDYSKLCGNYVMQ